MCSLSRRSLLALPFVLFLCVSLLCLPTLSRADSRKVTSNPAGATVELDGVPVGTTPFEADFPGGYFHGTKTALGARLEHPMVARVSLPGLPLVRSRLRWGSGIGSICMATSMANTGSSSVIIFISTCSPADFR